MNSLPEDHKIASSRWTRRTLGELIRVKLGIELSEQSVGNYLERWDLTPQKPARHAREADPDEITVDGGEKVWRLAVGKCSALV